GSAQVRVDTGFRAGDEVSPYYDPMLAKLIAWGEDRAAACAGLLRALGDCEVVGVATNLDLLERIVAQPDFAAGRVDTGLIERHRDTLLVPRATPPRAFVAAALAQYARVRRERAQAAAASGDPWSPWAATDAWWNNTATHALAFTFADGADARTLVLQPQ